jgi:hypothetical protein
MAKAGIPPTSPTPMSANPLPLIKPLLDNMIFF